MEISEVMEQTGIKILDGTIFRSSKEGLLTEVHPCNKSEELPLESILAEVDVARKNRVHLNQEDVYSVEEVGEEINVLLDKVNKVYNFFRMYEQEEPDFKRGRRQENKYIARGRNNGSEEGRKKVNQLNVLAKELMKLIKSIRRNDIRDDFGEDEKAVYNDLFSYFSYVCGAYDNIKIDYKERHESLKNRNPCQFKTDEKLLSAAMTVSLREPVVLVSSDSDMLRMLSFFDSDKKNKPPSLRKNHYNIRLYADYHGKGHELQDLNGATRSKG